MKKEIINTDNAPRAIGPYSQGIIVDKLIFTSGQIPLDIISGKVISGDIKLEIMQIMNNIDAILKEGGSSLADIIKMTVYLTDINLFPDLNNVFKEFFRNNEPARSTIEVSALPMGARVEIDAISVIVDE